MYIEEEEKRNEGLRKTVEVGRKSEASYAKECD